MAREVTARYVDPLAQVWLAAAARIGLRVVRTPDAYAATDGNGTLAIGESAVLDADDSLAQMIFHELCHSLVEGEASFGKPDWGMDNTGPDHDWREHACLRAQWVLTGRYGLRRLFAPTTDFRAFWATLGGDVLADRRDRSVVAAIAALNRADEPPWAPALTGALEATAAIAAVAAPFAAPGTLAADARPALHPTGMPAGERDATCATCAWRSDHRAKRADNERGTTAWCRQAERRVQVDWRACERYEAALDCQTCGACCREAYQSVEVTPRDPFLKKQPAYVVDRTTYLEVLRDGDRCAALHGGSPDPADPEHITTYRCVIYDDRPRTCREFTLGSVHCLTARRRVGLSL